MASIHRWCPDFLKLLYENSKCGFLPVCLTVFWVFDGRWFWFCHCHFIIRSCTCSTCRVTRIGWHNSGSPGMIVSIIKVQHKRCMIGSETPCKSKMICKTGMVFSAQLISSFLKQLELAHRIRGIKFRLDYTSVVSVTTAPTDVVVSCCWSWSYKRINKKL